MSTIELQAAHDAIDASLGDSSDESHHLIATKCRALMRGYDVRWRNAGYVPFMVESMLRNNLVNPVSKKRSRSFTIAGKLDVLATYFGKTVLIDHKTTSQDISDPNSAYWRQLVIEGQVTHYMLLAWMEGTKVDHAVWDCLRKPSIAPKKLTKAERASVVAEGVYFGQRIDNADRQALASGDERETLSMYEARLSHDCISERPEWYFQRRVIPRIDQEIFEYAKKLWDIGQDILHVRNTDRHYTNPGACLRFGTPCQYLGICSGHDEPHSERWKVRENVHPELPDLEGDGRDAITNSRISCFQTCRKMHHFKYELGIERIDEEEKEALWFGSCWHTAQEHYWKAMIPQMEMASDSV